MNGLQLPPGAQTRRLGEGEFEQITARWGNRQDWGKGPWLDEPDRIEWRIPELPGIVCLAARGPMGSWCGYVAVPPGHPVHGKDYNEIDVDVHGGLTFADACQAGSLICHVPAPGEPDDVWWLGFDCGHGFDYSPAMRATLAKSSRLVLDKMNRGEEVPDFEDREWLEREAVIPEYKDPPVGELLAGLGDGTYRDVRYIVRECEGLAWQLALVEARCALVGVLTARGAQ